MNDKAIVVSVRCTELKEAEALGPVAVRYCGTCGEAVWASESVTTMEQERSVEYVCTVCAPLDRLPTNTKVALAPAERKKLEERFGTWTTALGIARLQSRNR